MLDTLINLFTSTQLVRRLIGGTWFCIADYSRSQIVWLRDVPDGYHVIEAEEWT